MSTRFPLKVGMLLVFFNIIEKCLQKTLGFTTFSPDIQIMLLKEKAPGNKNKRFVRDGQPFFFASDL